MNCRTGPGTGNSASSTLYYLSKAVLSDYISSVSPLKEKGCSREEAPKQSYHRVTCESGALGGAWDCLGKHSSNWGGLREPGQRICSEAIPQPYPWKPAQPELEGKGGIEALTLCEGSGEAPKGTWGQESGFEHGSC